MAGIISNNESQRLLANRLEIYRLAVQNGFYNDWPGTVPYRGFQIVQEDGGFKVVQNGVALISLKQMHIAKVWITCRLDNCGLVEAHARVKAGN